MQTIKLDLQRQSILTPLKAKQNDRYSRFFKVVMLDGSTAFSIPSGAALTVRYITPSGSGWYDTITEIDNTTKHSAFAISGNEVTVELAEAMLTKPGNGMLCLQIYTATGYRIGTWDIPLEIEADLITDSTIAASDYYNVLTAQVAQTLGYRDAAANSATAAAASAALAQQISQQSKGWYATDTALKAAFPTGQNGWWAIVGAGDNIWTWDADTGAWVNTHTQTDLSNYYTKAQADDKFATGTQGVAARAYKADQASGSYFKLGDVNQQAEILATTDLNILFKFHGNLIYALYLGEYGQNGPWSLCPNGDNSLSLGNASARWKSLYAASGTIQTSDLRKKTDIAPLTKATDFIMRLRPISYKMIDGETGRTHWGLGAQDVQQAMQESGLSDMDFAGFIRSPRMENVDTGVQDKDGNPIIEKRVIPNEYEYGLRYEEFIAPLIATVQAQQCAIDDLTERVAALEQKW